MKGDSTPNFVRPFVLYTIGKYVCPTTQQYVDNRYLGIVRNVETIKSTNFGQLTLDHLMTSVSKSGGQPTIASSNTIIINIQYIKFYGKFSKLFLL